MGMHGKVLASAERTANASQVDPDLPAWKAKAWRQLHMVLVEALRRDVKIHPAIVGRDGQTGFRSQERLVLHADFVDTIDDDVAFRVGVAAFDRHAPDEIALRVNRRCLQSTFGIRQGCEDFVGHVDGGKRAAAGFHVPCGNQGHGFAFETDDFVGEYWLVGDQESVGRFARQVPGRKHRSDALDSTCLRNVDPFNLGRGMRRAQRRTPEHVVGNQVRRELKRAADLVRRVRPLQRRGDSGNCLGGVGHCATFAFAGPPSSQQLPPCRSPCIGTGCRRGLP